jgi:hypothetical protein
MQLTLVALGLVAIAVALLSWDLDTVPSCAELSGGDEGPAGDTAPRDRDA